jgi:hypothetical protein
VPPPRSITLTPILSTAIRVERLLRGVHPHRPQAHLLPIRHHQRALVRDQDQRPPRHPLLPGELVLRVGQLPLLRLAERLRLHPRLRPVQPGDLPVHPHAAGADLREPQHVERAAARRRQQAGPHRRRGRRRGQAHQQPRGEAQGYRQSGEEALEVRIHRVQRQVQLEGGGGVQGADHHDRQSGLEGSKPDAG